MSRNYGAYNQYLGAQKCCDLRGQGPQGPAGSGGWGGTTTPPIRLQPGPGGARRRTGAFGGESSSSAPAEPMYQRPQYPWPAPMHGPLETEPRPLFSGSGGPPSGGAGGAIAVGSRKKRAGATNANEGITMTSVFTQSSNNGFGPNGGAASSSSPSWFNTDNYQPGDITFAPHQHSGGGGYPGGGGGGARMSVPVGAEAPMAVTTEQLHDLQFERIHRLEQKQQELAMTVRAGMANMYSQMENSALNFIQQQAERAQESVTRSQPPPRERSRSPTGGANPENLGPGTATLVLRLANQEEIGRASCRERV